VVCLRRWPFLAFLSVYQGAPLYGAALTFFAGAQRKQAKKAGSHRQLVGVHPWRETGTAQDGTRPRATNPGDKAVIRSSVALRAPPAGITPAAYSVGWLTFYAGPVYARTPRAFPCSPIRDARSAGVGWRSALSRTGKVRGTVSSRSTLGAQRWIPAGQAV